ncbi:Ankyrin repeat domain-containing protein 50 [Colletotrichum siamense]|uniref:Ankyrin repeat domain-containing protein 50 n=1 Tax=Colletotrichum siamense TaxID=690259 RepID=UPI0018726B28|nr:Ankyrin repeat domain-containing protein 50 [Colletotrichum siamense]KAF5486785.1 Ankyrin repeat domain-containing protein 50 [Colletotrichum siamense]
MPQFQLLGLPLARLCDEVVQGLRLPFEKTIESDSDDSDESSIDSSSESDVRSNELNTRTELGQNTAEIDQILSSLVKLSFRIRGPTSRTAQIDARAMSHKEMVSVEHSEPVDLMFSYETFDRQYVDEVFRQFHREAFEGGAAQASDAAFVDESNSTGEAKNSASYLKDIWGKSITNRRRIFAYWRRHARKLAKEEPTARPREIAIRQSQPLPMASEPARVPEASTLLQNLAPSQVPSSAVRTMLSGTEATMYRSDDVDLDTGSVVSYASTAFDADGISSELPPPPSIKPGHTEEHIVRDIQPYMCTYDDCTEAETMYPSKASWLEHEAKAHRRVWRCFEHKDLFKSRSALVRHFEVSHPNLSEAQIQHMSELAVVSTKDERVVCPYCQSHGPFESNLADHIALHMERMASFAVPRSSGEEDDSTHGGNSGAAQGARSAASLRSVSLRFSSSQSDQSSGHTLDINQDDKASAFEDADASSENKPPPRSTQDLLGPDHDRKSFEEHLQKYHPGTCEWFLCSERYKEWVDTPGETLFCPGLPGAGKSVLSSVVFQDLQQTIQQFHPAAILVISGENYGAENDMVNLLRSLLKQLFEACKDRGFALNRRPEDFDTSLKETTSLDLLRTALQEMVTDFFRVFIIIDGFDLISDSDSGKATFIKLLWDITQGSFTSILVTSRDTPNILRLFKRSSTQRIEAPACDMEGYIRSALKKAARKIPPEKFDDLAAMNLIRNATYYSNGVFLAARNYVKSLTFDIENGVHLDSMQLDLMMDDFYEETIDRILSQKRPKAPILLLEFMLRFDRLKTEEFMHLLDIGPGYNRYRREEIAAKTISSCAGLVVVSGGYLEFCHPTISGSLSTLRFKFERSAVVTSSLQCIEYLSVTGVNRGPSKTDFDWEQRLNSEPCLPLVARSWGTFVREALSDLSDDTHDGRAILKRCKEFFSGKERVQAAIQALILTERAPSGPGYSQNYPHSWTKLHLATYFGLTQILQVMLKEANEDTREWLNWADDDSLVLLAAEQGHLFTLQELHRAWDRPGQTFKAGDGDRAVSKAARNGHADVVNYLASVGVLLTATPLRLAAENGHMDVVKILLERGAPVNANAREAQPLHGAVTAGHVEIAQVLIESGADINYNNGEFLSIAAERGNEAMAELLLANGIDVNGASPTAKPALSYAIQTKNIDIVDLLLIYGADPNRTGWYLSPMDYAIETGDDELIRKIREAKERFDSVRSAKEDDLDRSIKEAKEKFDGSDSGQKNSLIRMMMEAQQRWSSQNSTQE